MCIGHPSEERTRRERLDLSYRHDLLLLHRYAHGVRASSDRFALTHPVLLSERVGHGLGCLAGDLTGKGRSRRVYEHI